MSTSIDALPYYDKQLEDPAIKAKVDALIAAELKSTPPIDGSSLPPAVNLYAKNEALGSLFATYPEERLSAIDTSVYAPPSVPEGASVEEYAAAAKRGHIGEAHMTLRNENIGVMQTYGQNAWLVRNYQLNSELKEVQGALTVQQEQVTEVNRARRVAQESAGEHLTRLEGRWGDLVSSTVQLEMACMAMEGEVHQLRAREAALREEVEALEAAA